MSGSRRPRLTRRGWAVLLVGVVGAGVLLGTSGLSPAGDRVPVAAEVETEPPPASPSPSPSPAPVWAPAVAAPVDGELAPVDAAGLASTAPVVVVADTGDRLDRDLATWLALRLQAPLVDATAPAPAGARVAVVVGAATPPEGEVDVRRISRTSASVAPVDRAAGPLWLDRVAALRDRAEPPVPADLTPVADLLDEAEPASSSGVTLLVRSAGATTADVATAVALGHEVVTAHDRPLWDDPAAAAAVRDARVGLLGDGWEGADTGLLAWQLGVVQGGLELPGGGYEVFPGRRMVALYGNPAGGALGVLGEQPVDAAVVRAQEQAAAYAELVDEPVIPAFDIIATVASAGAGSRGDYSRRTPVAELRPWVDAARAAGMYVVLDLQSGRTDFLTQAREYEELLREPHVGLALDPEWRLLPNQVHLRQVGSVAAQEVNQVSAWLADLVRREGLPQKVFLVHQFRTSMIRDRQLLDTSRPELSYVLQMDGQGGQPAKLSTYASIRRDPPANVHWGWKNFHDEDHPTRSVADTVALDPSPVFVSYQ